MIKIMCWNIHRNDSHSPPATQRKIAFLFIINNRELGSHKIGEEEEKQFQRVVTIFVNDYANINEDLG